jgi:1-acyl-sn-glycerol-3-phosphate acyltransferase
MSHSGAREPGRAGRLASLVGRAYLRLAGWRIEGALPPVAKMVVIAAPHTSNWDLPHMLAVAWVLGVRPSWLGKREIFRWPFAGLMRRLGGLPVDRTSRGNLVEEIVAQLASARSLALVVPPSGTRNRASHWRSGFYHIACGARVPIVCAFLDYRRGVAGIGPTIRPSGVAAIDMIAIREFYQGVTARYPERTTPVRLREEDEAVTASG